MIEPLPHIPDDLLTPVTELTEVVCLLSQCLQVLVEAAPSGSMPDRFFESYPKWQATMQRRAHNGQVVERFKELIEARMVERYTYH